MKVKLSKIINSVSAFKVLTPQATNAKSAYKLAKALNCIQQELDTFETVKNNIAKKYQEEVDGKLQIPEEKVKEFTDEMMTLLDEEIELNVDFIPISDLAGLNITISNMMLMDYLFKE